jgi:oxygen-dependent protoporphyrinogen oxidase
MHRVLIVGGGISGLALAYRLEQLVPDAEVTVLEQQSRVGGVIDAAARDGFRVEAGPNGFLDNKPFAINLCRELGLGERLVPASDTAARNRFLLLNGKLHKLPTGLLSFLTTGVVGWRAKLGLISERFRSPRTDSADESIDAFARRRFGAEAAETLVDAFVTGIYAGDPRLLSLPASFPRLAAMERDFGSVTRGFIQSRRRQRAESRAQGKAPQRTGQMWSFREGLRLLVDTLRARLRRSVVVGVGVGGIRRTETGWQARGDGQDKWDADVLVLACPAYKQAALLTDLDAELAERIGGIAYNRVAVVAVGYRATDVPHPLDGFGYLSPQRSRRDVLGVQWCSSIFPDRAPASAVLLRAMCGGWNRPEIVDWDDARLLAAVRREFAQAMNIHAEPVFHQIVRWDRAIPQYHLGHLALVAWIEQRTVRHPGLYLGGNCYRGVALNDCVEQADLLARRIVTNVQPNNKGEAAVGNDSSLPHSRFPTSQSQFFFPFPRLDVIR